MAQMTTLRAPTPLQPYDPRAPKGRKPSGIRRDGPERAGTYWPCARPHFERNRRSEHRSVFVPPLPRTEEAKRVGFAPMSLFEIGESGLLPFRKVRAGSDLYKREIEDLARASRALYAKAYPERDTTDEGRISNVNDRSSDVD